MTIEKQIEEWNRKYPEGTRVNVTDDFGEVTEQVTRSIAWDVCGSAVVMISGRTGGYLLERCVPVED